MIIGKTSIVSKYIFNYFPEENRPDFDEGLRKFI